MEHPLLLVFLFGAFLQSLIVSKKALLQKIPLTIIISVNLFTFIIITITAILNFAEYESITEIIQFIILSGIITTFVITILTSIIISREKILIEIDLGILISLIIVTTYYIWELIGNVAIFITLIIPAIIFIQRKKKTIKSIKFTLYVIAISLLIFISIQSIPEILTVFNETSQINYIDAIILGLVYFNIIAYISYILMIIPIPQKYISYVIIKQMAYEQFTYIAKKYKKTKTPYGVIIPSITILTILMNHIFTVIKTQMIGIYLIAIIIILRELQKNTINKQVKP
ncbi:MAG: hypothetical protein ACMXYE_02615 [Candidatus Woesearchaeota archaeon]